MNTKKWLETLTVKQLRALASQNKIKDWKTSASTKLISILSLIEGVEQPKSTLAT
jgi:hypothetical protein